MTLILGKPQTRIIYQRLAPPKTAPAAIRAVYEYGCHMLRELWLAPRGIFGGRVSPETQQRAFTVMEAYKQPLSDTNNERVVEGETILTVDRMEHERQPPLDESGNEQWGAAMDRLRTFRQQARGKFQTEQQRETRAE